MKISSPVQGTVLDKAKVYVENLLADYLPEELCFHDIHHTRNVVRAVETIARAQEINQENFEILRLAAWFHDTGFTKSYLDHESASKEIAREALKSWNYPDWKIICVTSCIEATRMPQNPKNELEKIICDADLFHLADENYLDKSYKLREETCNKTQCIPEACWYLDNLKFLIRHSYFTEFGKSELEQKKQKNIVLNLEKLNQLITTS